MKKYIDKIKDNNLLFIDEDDYEYSKALDRNLKLLFIMFMLFIIGLLLYPMLVLGWL